MCQVPDDGKRKDELASGDKCKAEERSTADDFRVVEVPGGRGAQDASQTLKFGAHILTGKYRCTRGATGNLR